MDKRTPRTATALFAIRFTALPDLRVAYGLARDPLTWDHLSLPGSLRTLR